MAPSPEVHFEPVVKLEQVETKTCEEEEDVYFKMYFTWTGNLLLLMAAWRV